MALQAFVGPGLFLSFVIFFAQKVGPLDGGSASRKATTYTQTNTNTE
jgi:hypothetical protein